MTHRVRRPAVLAAAGLLLAGGLAGCGAAEDIASAAGDGASSAAVGAAKDAALDQVCGAVGDGQVSEEDLQRIRAAVRAAEAAGFDEGLVEQADELLGDGDDGASSSLDPGQVEQLQQACQDAGAGS